MLAEIQSHAAPLRAAFAAYATEAPPIKRKSAKGSAERPGEPVLSYTGWCRFAADRRLPLVRPWAHWWRPLYYAHVPHGARRRDGTGAGIDVTITN